MRIDVQLLGEFAVAVSGVRIARERWRNVRAAQLVQLLALAKGHRLRREQVIDAFWPDLSPAAGAANLRKAAHLARLVLGFEDAVVLAGGDASLAPGSDVRVDTDAFSAAAIDALSSGAPGACAAAAQLYTGVLLPDAVYQPWSDEPRLRLRQLYVDLLRAGRQWERLAAEEPTDEQAHRELMRRDLADGNRASALRWYARLESALRLNLGVAPEPDTRRLRDAGVEALPADGDLFVGRTQELQRIEHWLQLAPAERQGGLVTFGHAGMGKTALGRQMALLASRVGNRVITVTAHEAAPAYGVVIAAIERLILERRTVLDQIGEVSRTVLAQLTPLAEPATAPTGPLGRHQVFGAVRRTLLAASAGSPVILQVDDAHLLGPADLDLLLDLAVTGRPLFVALALRPLPADSPLEQRIARLVRSHHLIAIRLGPMSDSDTRALLAASHTGLDPALTSHIVRAAQGNPFLALELAHHDAAPAGHLPETTREAIVARLCDVPPAALTLLNRLALAGDEFDASMVTGLGEESEADTFRTIDALLQRGVLVVSRSAYRFRHELVRQSLAGAVLPHHRIDVHRTIARCLARVGAAPATVAEHWKAAGCTEEATPCLLDAAGRALRIGAFADALRHVDQLLAWTPSHPDALRLRAEALDGRGDPAAVRAYHAAADVAGPAASDDLRAKGALAQIKLGDPLGALKALEPLQPSSPEGKLAEALAYCGAAAMGVAPPARGTRRAAAARRLALDTGDTASIVIASWAQAAVAHARGELHGSLWTDLYDTRHVPHLAMRVFDGQLCITQRLLYGSRPYADVIHFASALAAESERLGAARGHAFGVTLRGEAHLLSGDLSAAEADLTLGARLHRAIGAATGESFSLQRLSEAAMYRGEHTRARALLDEALEVARQTDIGFHLLDRIYGARITQHEAPEEAFAALLDAEDKVRGPLETCPGCRITLEVPAAIAAARAGQIERAEAHAAAAEYLARVVMQLPAWHAAVDEVHGHLARARGERPSVVAAHFVAAADRFRRAGHPLDAARCEALGADA